MLRWETHGLWLPCRAQLLLPAGTKTVLNRGQAIHIQPSFCATTRALLVPERCLFPCQLPPPRLGTDQREGQAPSPSAAGARRAFLGAAAAGGHGSLTAGSHPTPRGGGKPDFPKIKLQTKTSLSTLTRAYKGHFRRVLLVGSKSQLLA